MLTSQTKNGNDALLIRTHCERHATGMLQALLRQGGDIAFYAFASSGWLVRREICTGGLCERAHLIGGMIDINGVEEKGTVVIVRVPVSG
jgi:hypothetical protein